MMRALLRFSKNDMGQTITCAHLKADGLVHGLSSRCSTGLVQENMPDRSVICLTKKETNNPIINNKLMILLPRLCYLYFYKWTVTA